MIDNLGIMLPLCVYRHWEKGTFNKDVVSTPDAVLYICTFDACEESMGAFTFSRAMKVSHGARTASRLGWH